MRELGGAYVYIKWGDQEPGFEIEGTYRGTREDNFGNHPTVLVANDGQRFSLNSCGSLDYKMGFAEIGDRVLVKYLGTEPLKTKYGVKDVHQFKVFNLDDGDVSPDDFSDADEVGASPVKKTPEESLGLDSLDGFDDDVDLGGVR